MSRNGAKVIGSLSNEEKFAFILGLEHTPWLLPPWLLTKLTIPAL